MARGALAGLVLLGALGGGPAIADDSTFLMDSVARCLAIFEVSRIGAESAAEATPEGPERTALLETAGLLSGAFDQLAQRGQGLPAGQQDELLAAIRVQMAEVAGLVRQRTGEDFGVLATHCRRMFAVY